MVDYCLVPHESLQYYADFNVVQSNKLFTMSGCQTLADPTSSISDHSVLYWTVNLPSLAHVQAQEKQQNNTRKKYDLTSIPQNFLQDPDVWAQIQDTVIR